MQITLYPVLSSLHDAKTIDNQTFSLIEDLKTAGGFDISITSIDRLYSGDLALILVQSGGSEGVFLKLLPRLKPPFYLLTYGTNNSLAASMEILSYLKSKGHAAEILHGSTAYIARRLNELASRKPESAVNLGVIGKPSDWLIASRVDRKACREKLNVRLVDIDIKELELLARAADLADFRHSEPLIFEETELCHAEKVVVALEKIVDKYHLQGLTLRCFDLLGDLHTTGCLGLSLLNKNRLVGTCEGDVPAMLSMYILNKVTGQCGFQANPSRIDVETNRIVFAHCTLPLDMATSHRLMTHYESGIGVAIRGQMRETDVTVFKLSPDLRTFYAEEGRILGNLNDPNLCRTQIEVQMDDVRYFLTSPLGNHHVIAYGQHKKALQEFCTSHL